MPIALKEWAVTVRALAEGEQLLPLRKGGLGEMRSADLEHDRFFLYPTFEHQRNDVVRASHQPELRRAIEEGVWPDAGPPAHALTRDGGVRRTHPAPPRARAGGGESASGQARGPPPRAWARGGGVPQPDRVRIRAWAEVAAHWTTSD